MKILVFCRVIGRHALRGSTGREAVDLDFGEQNPMLVIPVDRGLPALSRSLSPFSPNIVPAPESHRSVAVLVSFVGVLARSYPVRTVIQFSFWTAFFLFRQIEKADLHEPFAERIEIPFQSKKSCKSAL